jgi:hypothetical protein
MVDLKERGGLRRVENCDEVKPLCYWTWICFCPFHNFEVSYAGGRLERGDDGWLNSAVGHIRT